MPALYTCIQNYTIKLYPPHSQHTLTLAHLMPGLTAMWQGPERDEYLNGGPWFYAQTEFTNFLII